MSTKTKRPSTEEVLLADVVALMETSDLAPWRKPWTPRSGDHRNPLSGSVYRGVNSLLLELGLLMRGSTIHLWCGGAQAKQHHWCPKKGSRSVRIVRPQLNKREQIDDAGKPVLDGNGDAVVAAWVSYRPATVFNFNDLKGMNPEAQAALELFIQEQLGDAPDVATSVRLDQAETHLESWEVPVVLGGSRACYSSSLDQISMPQPDDFISRETFCATWLHEQAHSTGHSSRLNRPLGNRFGSPAYAREELIAEFASVLACLRLGIGYEIEQHAAYLKSWATALKEGGSKELFKVLSEARQAADLVAPEAADAEPIDGAQLCDALDDEQDYLSTCSASMT